MNQAEIKTQLITMHPADIQALLRKEGKNFKNFAQLGKRIGVHRQHVSVTVANLRIVLDAIAEELATTKSN
jgi:lambda repressor-like predicted transcriptional regulator